MRKFLEMLRASSEEDEGSQENPQEDSRQGSPRNDHSCSEGDPQGSSPELNPNDEGAKAVKNSDAADFGRIKADF